jgi:histone deacetylase 6
LNLPLNHEDEQYVGDSDYIYAFERAIFPVLRKFKPKFVFVSCGFDCLYGDPLGKQSVSRDGLMYILNAINQRITTKINVVLEGGYRFEQIAKSA